MHDILIRLATPKDAELIADLSRITFYETFAAQNTKEDMDKFMNEVFTKPALMQELYDEQNIFLLAFAGDDAVGYVRMRPGEIRPELNGKNSIELARIYAATKSIGKGVGSALMKRSLEIATEMGKEVIWLGVFQKNDRAIKFYEKWGFEKFAEHDFLLGNDLQRDWLMKKELVIGNLELG
jgi:ribosomal protein S18 acetylase RimI-like enzyme